MYIERSVKKQIQSKLFKGKIILLYGPRRVGKTTLVRQILKDYGSGRYLLCDEPDIRQLLTNKTSTELKTVLGNAKLVVIDEAQRVENIGITLKLLVDTYPDIQIIATGSSSFDLSNKINEPLTGRNYEFHLFPFSYDEIRSSIGEIESKRMLAKMLTYGMYPEIFLGDDSEELLKKMTQDQLYKDVLMYQHIRKPQVLDNLLSFLALSVGQEISYSKLAQRLEISRDTVMWYLRLLEQSFIIYRLSPISKNKKKEITRLQKYYFYDVGIRNALINTFSKTLENRIDLGSLWENFIISEKIKKNYNNHTSYTYSFWRTKSGSEIDLIENQTTENCRAFEMKFSKNIVTNRRAFQTEFPNTELSVINQENFSDFL